MHLGFSVTQHCNLRCPHCIRDDVETVVNLDPALLFSAVDEARAIFPRVEVAMTGGEPTIHPQWEGIVAGLHARGVPYGFVSNGWHMKRLMPGMDLHPPARVRLSLSGASEEVHDAERGRGSFRRVLLAVAMLASRGIPTSLGFVVDRRDRHQVREAADLAESLGCVAIRFALAQPVPASTARGSDLTPAEYYEVRDEIARLQAEPRRTRVSLDHGAPFDGEERLCDTFSRRRVYVDAHGRLSLCCQLSEYGSNEADVVADLRRTSLREAWGAYEARLEALQDAARPRGDGSVTDPFPCMRCARALGKTAWLGDHPASPWAEAADGVPPPIPLVPLTYSPAAR